MLILAGATSGEFRAEQPPVLQASDAAAMSPDLAPSCGEISSVPSIRDMVVERAYRDVARAPGNVRSHLNLGIALFGLGEFESAVGHLRTAAADARFEHVASVYLAKALANIQALPEAEALLVRVNESSTGPLIASAMADIAVLQGDLPRAAAILRNLRDNSPRRLDVCVALGRVLLRQGEVREAIRTLRAAIREDPRHAVAYHVLGVAYAMLPNRRRARESFEAALHLNRQYSDALLSLVKLLTEEEAFAEVVAMGEPSDQVAVGIRCEVREYRAWCYVKLDRYREARKELMQELADASSCGIMDTETHGRLTNNLGMCYVLLRDVAKARKLFEKSIEVAPQLTSAPYVNLGRLLHKEGDSGGAREILRTCIELFPRETDAGILFAAVCETLGRVDDGIVQLRALIAEPDAPPAVYSYLGALLADGKGDFDQAIEVLTAGYERWPTDPILINNLAYVHLMRGTLDKASAFLDHLPRSLENPYVLATRGLLALLKGDLEGAQRGYADAERLAAVQGQPEVARAARQKLHLELARHFLRLGKTAEAQRAIFQGLKVKGKSQYRRDLELLRASVVPS